jgi:phosphonate transport system ATP-binding protein
MPAPNTGDIFHSLHAAPPGAAALVTMNPVVLRAHNVRRTFGSHQALRDVSIEVRRGERVALLGASGSGKSTLIRCLCGLETTDPGMGRIEAFGQVLQENGRNSADIRALRQRVGVIFQQFNLVGRLNVMQNVLTGLAGQTSLWRGMTGRYTLAHQARALDALDMLGLAPQAFQRASTLSGGQQQRAAIARVLVQGAEVVLADEPVASLDPKSTQRVMEHLTALNRDAGMTLVVSLHHVALAQRYCDRVVALRDGVLVFDGPSAALSTDFLTQLYGTSAAELLHGSPEPSSDFAPPVSEPVPLALAA